MVVQSNIPALNAHRNLGINNNALSKNLEKLSSGYKINRAADDAAGLAISEKMRSQIRGLEMAEQNTQNAVQLIQTAEGGLNETHAILHRMRELAVQASNGTYTDEDRAQISLEYETIKGEINRIADSTHYNGIKLLNGELDSAACFGTIAAGDDTDSIFYSAYLSNTLDEGSTVKLENFDIDPLTGEVKADITIEMSDATSVVGSPAGDGIVAVYDKYSNTYTFTVGGTSVSVLASTLESLNASGDLGPGGTELTVTAQQGSNLVFQIGANGGQDQRVTLDISDMSCNALGIQDTNVLDVDTPNGANPAIDLIDRAVNLVSAQRAELGALQNRLEHTLNGLNVSIENLSAAESTIRDTDMAKEMMEFTQNSILVQAAQAMLAQANALPQGILSLLG